MTSSTDRTRRTTNGSSACRAQSSTGTHCVTCHFTVVQQSPRISSPVDVRGRTRLVSTRFFSSSRPALTIIDSIRHERWYRWTSVFFSVRSCGSTSIVDIRLRRETRPERQLVLVVYTVERHLSVVVFLLFDTTKRVRMYSVDQSSSSEEKQQRRQGMPVKCVEGVARATRKYSRRLVSISMRRNLISPEYLSGVVVRCCQAV
jgi:hypothetical protein